MSQKSRISLSQARAMQEPLGVQLDIEDAIAAKRRAEFESQISIAVAKRRATQGRKNAADRENGPTPERVAKLMQQEDVAAIAPPIRDADTRALTKAHTIVAPVDRYGKYWPADLERAARDIRNIFLIAESGGQRVTASYDGVGSSVPGARHGGVQDHIRECQSLAELIKTKFPACVREISWFLTQIVIKTDGSAMRFEDVGALESPWRSVDAQKGVGYGMFVRSIQVIAPFLAEQRALGWGRGVSTPEAARALNAELRAMTQILREKEARKQRQEAQTKMLKGGK